MTSSDPVAPAPRNYPAGVIVVKRSARGPASAPANTTIAEIEDWLLRSATLERDMLLLLESFLWRMVSARLPIDRASLHIGTLHPQLLGFAWNWRRSDGLCDEVKVEHATADTDSFKLNPLSRIFATDAPLRRDPRSAEAQAEFPLMIELAAMGVTDYFAKPMGGYYRHAVTFATVHPAGFSDQEIADIDRLLSIFTLHVERTIATRIAGNALDAYLGPAAATKVLNGSIRRGGGEAIRAVIWVADLRGFTDLSDRLSGAEMIELLNAYFEQFAGAVLAHGGEVLKFIGDGLLAVFPRGDDMAAAANAALEAAEQALRGLDALNASPPPALADVQGWRPLRAGIALHEGEVFFGNIGAPQRLDFTVIGAAVNEASRVEALQKTLGRNILITEAVARHITRPLDHLGEHALRGVVLPIAIYSPQPAAP